MKRERATEDFFALDEAVDILLGAIACPLLVAALLCLCKATRRAVWRTLSSPNCCSAQWITDFTRRLWSLVEPRHEQLLLSPYGSCGGATWPIFMAPCAHTAPDRFYVGRINQLLMLEDAPEEDWDDGEDSGLYQCGETRAFLASYSDSHSQGFVMWMPVCCEKVRRFPWHYVARALADNIDMRCVLYNRDCVRRSHEERHLFIQ